MKRTLTVAILLLAVAIPVAAAPAYHDRTRLDVHASDVQCGPVTANNTTTVLHVTVRNGYDANRTLIFSMWDQRLHTQRTLRPVRGNTLRPHEVREVTLVYDGENRSGYHVNYPGQLTIKTTDGVQRTTVVLEGCQ